MPTLSEKKACPMAPSTTSGVTLLRSGFRRKRKPSAAPGRVMEKPTSTRMMTSSSGINSFE